MIQRNFRRMRYSGLGILRTCDDGCVYLVQVVANFEVFGGHITKDEQRQLMKYLPSVDTSELPDRFVSIGFTTTF